MINEHLFTSEKDDWTTPDDLFQTLHAEFRFDLDPCADDMNYKCDTYITKEENGLLQDWGGYRVFCNPPYGKEVAKWVKKAHDEVLYGNCLIAVLLLASWTDTRYFHQYILNDAYEIRFVKGRLKFGGAKQSTQFGSMIVIFKKEVVCDESKTDLQNVQAHRICGCRTNVRRETIH